MRVNRQIYTTQLQNLLTKANRFLCNGWNIFFPGFTFPLSQVTSVQEAKTFFKWAANKKHKGTNRHGATVTAQQRQQSSITVVKIKQLIGQQLLSFNCWGALWHRGNFIHKLAAGVLIEQDDTWEIVVVCWNQTRWYDKIWWLMWSNSSQQPGKEPSAVTTDLWWQNLSVLKV